MLLVGVTVLENEKGGEAREEEMGTPDAVWMWGGVGGEGSNSGYRGVLDLPCGPCSVVYLMLNVNVALFRRDYEKGRRGGGGGRESVKGRGESRTIE